MASLTRFQLLRRGKNHPPLPPSHTYTHIHKKRNVVQTSANAAHHRKPRAAHTCAARANFMMMMQQGKAQNTQGRRPPMFSMATADLKCTWRDYLRHDHGTMVGLVGPPNDTDNFIQTQAGAAIIVASAACGKFSDVSHDPRQSFHHDDDDDDGGDLTSLPPGN